MGKPWEMKMETESKTYVIQKTEKANSYEFGKAGNRFKVYFETAEDLKEQIDKLRDLGFPTEQEVVK